MNSTFLFSLGITLFEVFYKCKKLRNVLVCVFPICTRYSNCYLISFRVWYNWYRHKLQMEIHYTCSMARKNLMLDYMAIKEHYASKQRKFLPNRFTWEMVRKIMKSDLIFSIHTHLLRAALSFNIISYINVHVQRYHFNLPSS